MTFYCFAYGSNMLTERLKARCPGAIVLGTAFAEGSIIEFSNRSELDGSGKATLGRATGQRTPGVLFKIPNPQCRALDRAEGAGKGYDRCDAFHDHRSGSAAIVQAVTYLSKTRVEAIVALTEDGFPDYRELLGYVFDHQLRTSG